MSLENRARNGVVRGIRVLHGIQPKNGSCVFEVSDTSDNAGLRCLPQCAYAIEFLRWCVGCGLVGWFAWRKLKYRNFDFAEDVGLVPLSEMALSKALHELQLDRRVRYLRPGDEYFDDHVHRGCKRPRGLEFYLPRTVQEVSDIEQLCPRRTALLRVVKTRPDQ